MLPRKNILVEEEILKACPGFVGVAVYAQVTNTAFSPELWAEINQILKSDALTLTTETLKQIPGIAATRQVYRKLGKDPSRYRPSNEALIRRVLQGKDLYQINTLVDLVNLCSIVYAYSIGGFDYAKIQGDTIRLGVGRKDEPYEGIGRGAINIEGLPVYRDSVGGIGTPTSDNERTKLSLDTTQFLAVINGYDGDEQNAVDCARRMERLLQIHTGATWTAIEKFAG